MLSAFQTRIQHCLKRIAVIPFGGVIVHPPQLAFQWIARLRGVGVRLLQLELPQTVSSHRGLPAFDGVLAVAGCPRFALLPGCFVRFLLQVVDGALCLKVVLARTQRLQFEVLAGAAGV